MKNGKTIILGIESSCDETACSIVADGRQILSNIISSQADFHEKYGGVVPELASRMHLDAVSLCIREALSEADLTLSEVDAVAVTYGPGLVGALLVGLSAAKGLCEVTGLPLVGVNHLKGHIAGNYLSFPDLEPPFLCLLASGGNSMIVKVNSYTDVEVLGRTRDDAAGEAIDKIARVIGLGYPGGPKMDKAGQGGNPESFVFARTHMSDTLDYSFSGIKTSALNTINNMRAKGQEPDIRDFSASYQKCISDELVRNLKKAVKLTGIKTVCMAGGVSANSVLRSAMDKMGKDLKVKVCYPELKYCTDNGAMIASAGYYEYLSGVRHGLDLNAKPSLEL